MLAQAAKSAITAGLFDSDDTKASATALNNAGEVAAMVSRPDSDINTGRKSVTAPISSKRHTATSLRTMPARLTVSSGTVHQSAQQSPIAPQPNEGHQRSPGA
ncbi:MAG TPA: hypothetical protein VIF37_10340 [Methylobacter sp.]